MLYPLKFTPIYKTKVWGGNKIRTIKNDNSTPDNCGESWEISGVQEDISIISNGRLKGNSLEEIIEIYMGELVGEKVFDKFGVEFPILMKIINSNENLSIQVHPDNDTANERHNAWGKSELWYIIEAEENARLISGFNTNTNKAQLINDVKNNELDTKLNQPIVKSGETYYIPSGRIHSIGKGITLLEIQQTSDITYRIYDYGRENRDLHLDLAVDIVDYKKTENIKTDFNRKPDKSNQIIKNELFTINFLPVMNNLERDYFELDSFVIYYCVNGEIIIKYRDNTETIKAGETILIPAEIKAITLIPTTYSEIIEVYL